MCAENSARSFRNRPFSGVQEKRGCSRESCRFCVSQTGICLWKSGWGSGNETGMDYLICAGVSETLQRNRRFPALTTAPVRQTGRASGQSVRDGRAETERQKRKILPAVFTGHFALRGGGPFRFTVDENFGKKWRGILSDSEKKAHSDKLSGLASGKGSRNLQV